MEDLRITPQELRNEASSMKTKIEEMKEALAKASSVMNRTSGSFAGTAADTVRGKYEELSKKFDLFYNEMTSYAIFLEKTAAAYENTNEAMKKAANDILMS